MSLYEKMIKILVNNYAYKVMQTVINDLTEGMYVTNVNAYVIIISF